MGRGATSHEWSVRYLTRAESGQLVLGRDRAALSPPNTPSVPDTRPTSQVASADRSSWTCPKPAPAACTHWRKGCGVSSLPAGEGPDDLRRRLLGAGTTGGPQPPSTAVVATVRQALAALRGGDPRLPTRCKRLPAVSAAQHGSPAPSISPEACKQLLSKRGNESPSSTPSQSSRLEDKPTAPIPILKPKKP